MIQKLFFSFLFLMCILKLSATHNRAGEITFKQIGPLTLEVTVTTYTKTSSIDADRDELTVVWGDGFQDTVARDNEVFLPNDTKRNSYTHVHTYPALGRYTISMLDPNRNANILNVNPPNSVIVPFFLQTSFTFTNTQFQGPNSSPILLQPPIDFGCVGQIFRHNPNAFDPDGDSLAYELIVPLQSEDNEVPNYSYPDEIVPQGNEIRLDAETGDFVWIVPQRRGEYNIAILIKEYRNGQLINSMIRDMQIFIDDCQNVPPRVEAPNEICVLAGDTVQFRVVAEAPQFEVNQLVRLSALGGPFELDNSPASFIAPNGYQEDPLTGEFFWPTNCNHISDQPYTVVFRAVDNFYDDTGLANLKTVRIKVVGPPPKEVLAEFANNRVNVSWRQPYNCEETDDEFFRGFSVWRREGSNPFPMDSCKNGLEGRGYERIGFNILDFDNGRYFFADNDELERGVTYCYRILADFAQLTPQGLPYNPVTSLPSKEVCLQLGRDLPFLTRVDVEITNPATGSIALEWTKPDPDDLDTLQNPGPYVYRLLRAEGINGTNFQALPGAEFSHLSFGESHTLSYLDDNINTVAGGYNYQIEFLTGSDKELLGSSPMASSVFLTIAPTDERNALSWRFNDPWNNFAFDIYRRDPGSSQFVLLDSTVNSTYTDFGLVNGEEYCYYILSKGSYGLTNLEDTLLNKSQRICAVPIDNIAPCPPRLDIDNLCLNNNFSRELINELSWDNPRFRCEDSEDLAQYRLYFSPPDVGDFNLLQEIDDVDQFSFLHDQGNGSLSGCYYITSLDSLGNESASSDTLCLDNCPRYLLPNTFTPNGDGQNELFIPLENLFIERIELQVFNRWGNLVFETTDAEINWDGTLMGNGEALPDATYYYVCRVFESRLTGVVEQEEPLKGFIDIIR